MGRFQAAIAFLAWLKDLAWVDCGRLVLHGGGGGRVSLHGQGQVVAGVQPEHDHGPPSPPPVHHVAGASSTTWNMLLFSRYSLLRHAMARLSGVDASTRGAGGSSQYRLISRRFRLAVR